MSTIPDPDAIILAMDGVVRDDYGSSDEEDYDLWSLASSDISLASSSIDDDDDDELVVHDEDDLVREEGNDQDMQEDGDGDIVMSDVSSLSSDDNNEDGNLDIANEEGGDDSSSDESTEHADGLSLSIVTTNHGTVMIEAKGSVPLQKTGHLTILSRLEKSLPVPFLTNILLLACPTYLKSLTFTQAALAGNDRDFEDFTSAIKTFSNLEELHLVDCCLLNDYGTKPLDTILYGVSSEGVLPKLSHIELYAVDIDREPVGSFLSPQALGYLLKHKTSLTKMSCEDLTLETKHIDAMAQALEGNTTLQTLKLWGCAIVDSGMASIANMLEKNNYMQQLDLSYNEIGDKGCQAIAKSLHVNKTLKGLKLVRNEDISMDGKGYEALLEMMKWNHVIEELLLQPHPSVNSDLGFYLFVNRHRYLLEDENITRGQLVDMLHAHRHDTTFLFHFLKAKPTLCAG